MLKPLDDFKQFLYTQYFSDGIKTTIGVLLPSLIFFQLDNVEIGLSLSLGAFCSSIADSPGPWVHRKNAMLITSAVVAVTALLTSLANESFVATALLLGCLSFTYSMFTVYGARASSVGTAGIFIMILYLDNHESELTPLAHTGLAVVGSLWYFLLSMLFSTLRPYRYAQQVLGECIQEIGRYMRLRASFYNTNIPVDKVFEQLVERQIKVHELQDNVREVLFKTRKLVNESTYVGRRLIIIFSDMVDLFEQTMATHHDYEVIRKRFENHHILPEFALLIHKLSTEIEYIGFCILHQISPQEHHISTDDLENLHNKLLELDKKGVQTLLLKKIFINLRNIFNRINLIYSYFKTQKNLDLHKKNALNDHEKFVKHQSFEFKLLKNNLNLGSGVFRFALRLSIVCLIGLFAGYLLPVGHHSYWIILTIMVILKPGFSTTKERNYQRVVGTIIGGIIGSLVLYFIPNENIRFIIMVISMIITYSTLRSHYFTSVLFMTPFILIFFSFISNGNGESIAIERIIDTLIGSGIAFASSYLLFPSWESHRIKSYMTDIIRANQKYLEAIYCILKKEDISITQYKLARKDVYVNTANLAAAFQRMLNEPKHKQYKARETHKFVVLNHILSSYLANLSSAVQENDLSLDTEVKKFFNKSIFNLKEAAGLLEKKKIEEDNIGTSSVMVANEKTDSLIIEQMELIAKVSTDIYKVTERLCST